jgi:hypothetical protein
MRARCTPDSSIADSVPMMAMTTSSSINVKAERRRMQRLLEKNRKRSGDRIACKANQVPKGSIDRSQPAFKNWNESTILHANGN